MTSSEIIGNKIRDRRLEYKMTLKQLSEAVNLSVGYLSQVENGLSTLSLSAMENLANCLNIEMSEFFHDPKSDAEQYTFRSYQRDKLQDAPDFFQYPACTMMSNTRVTIYEIYPTISEEVVQFSHRTAEFLYVLEGTCVMTLYDKEYILHCNDGLYIPSSAPHTWRNPTQHIIKIMGIAELN